MKSSWMPVTSSVSHRLIIDPILFSIFINDLGDGTECALSIFAVYLKQVGIGDRSSKCAAIQRVLYSLEKLGQQKC